MSDELQQFLEGVTGLVEANRFEQMALWYENRHRENPRTWRENASGFLETIGELDGMPVCISLFKATVDGQPILFWHATSTVVDHRMIDAWLQATMPKSAYRSGGHLNEVDATNFHNVFRDPSPASMGAA